MCIDLLPKKLLQAVGRKKKYEPNTFATNFTQVYIGIAITVQ